MSKNIKIQQFMSFLGIFDDNLQNYEVYLRNIMRLDHNMKRGWQGFNLEKISTEYEKVIELFESKYEGIKEFDDVQNEFNNNGIDGVLRVLQGMKEKIII